MTNDEFFDRFPSAVWPDELSTASWKIALEHITALMQAEYQRGLRREEENE